MYRKSFSILKRIELHATVTASDRVREMQAFSILKRIELHATQTAKLGNVFDPTLSVSSSGSSSMQPYNFSAEYDFTQPFQYPQADRAPCNFPILPDLAQADALTDFQYPQADRAPCNSTGRRGTG